MEDQGVRTGWRRFSGLGVLLFVIGLLRFCYPVPEAPKDGTLPTTMVPANELTPEEARLIVDAYTADLEARGFYQNDHGEWFTPDGERAGPETLQ